MCHRAPDCYKDQFLTANSWEAGYGALQYPGVPSEYHLYYLTRVYDYPHP